MAIVDEIIASGTVKQVVEFFTPERSAGIIKALLKIFEETYNSNSNQDFVTFSFEKIVLSHSGWLSFMQAPGDEIMKNLGYQGVALKLLEDGKQYLREHKAIE